MDSLKVSADHAATVTETVSSAFVPPLQLTEGQPLPIAANGGLSYMSFDRDGDAGTAAAMEAALLQIAKGEGQAVIDMLDNSPPGPIETKWGAGFRSYAECLEHISANNIEAPEGGLALPQRYRIMIFRRSWLPPRARRSRRQESGGMFGVRRSSRSSATSSTGASRQLRVRSGPSTRY